MKKVTLCTDSSFALFSALQILKSKGLKANLLTPHPFWAERFKDNPFITPYLIKAWPRGINRYNPKSVKRNQSQAQIIDYLKQHQPDELWFHEIYSDLWNWIAYHYKSINEQTILRLLPESFLNATDISVSPQKYRMLCLKAFMNKSYTPFKGSWIGINAQYQRQDLIQNIYLPRNFPHFYNNDKVEYFDFSLEAEAPQSHKALLVEQALLDRNMLKPNQLKDIYKNLEKDWKAQGITDVYIAPHPRAKTRDFAFANLPLLERKHIFLEEDIAAQNFAHIYSSYSMIFLSNQQLPARFVSFGLEMLLNFEQKDQYLRILKQMGIEFL